MAAGHFRSLPGAAVIVMALLAAAVSAAQKDAAESPGSITAVCASGHRATAETVLSAQRYLVEPLQADLLVVPEQPISPHISAILAASAVAVDDRPVPSPESLITALRQSPAATQYGQLTDNALSPAFGRRGGALFLYLSQSVCLGLVRRVERERR
eukprot:RCo009031